MDVEALAGDAHLAGVEQRADSDLRHDFFQVGVVAHDAGVVAGELQDHLLHGVRAVAQDALAHGDGAGEADVVDARVQRHLLAELGAAVDGLEHARRQHGLRQLAELEQRVRREGRRLDDHAVARRQRRHHLDRGQDQREVPRRDGAQHADGRVRRDDLDRVVFVLQLILEGDSS